MVTQKITPLAEKRIDEIITTIKWNGGYRFEDGSKMMSSWELAENLNNCYVARHFVNKDTVKKIPMHYREDNFVVENFELWKFQRGIKHACRVSPNLKWIEQNGYGFIFLTS